MESANPGWPKGMPLILAGLGAVIGAAGVDRLLYDLTSRNEAVPGLFVFAAARRTLSTAGGVLFALGVAAELARRRSS